MNCFRGHTPISASPHFPKRCVVEANQGGALPATCQKQEVQTFDACGVSAKRCCNLKY